MTRAPRWGRPPGLPKARIAGKAGPWPAGLKAAKNQTAPGQAGGLRYWISPESRYDGPPASGFPGFLLQVRSQRWRQVC
jgi:hypothetical protein